MITEYHNHIVLSSGEFLLRLRSSINWDVEWSSTKLSLWRQNWLEDRISIDGHDSSRCKWILKCYSYGKTVHLTIIDEKVIGWRSWIWRRIIAEFYIMKGDWRVWGDGWLFIFICCSIAFLLSSLPLSEWNDNRSPSDGHPLCFIAISSWASMETTLILSVLEGDCILSCGWPNSSSTLACFIILHDAINWSLHPLRISINKLCQSSNQLMLFDIAHAIIFSYAFSPFSSFSSSVFAPCSFVFTPCWIWEGTSSCSTRTHRCCSSFPHRLGFPLG